MLHTRQKLLSKIYCARESAQKPYLYLSFASVCVTQCANFIHSTPVPETTACSTSVETIETTEYGTSVPGTVIPTTPGYMTSTKASPVVPVVPTTKSLVPTPPATTPTTTPATSVVHSPTSIGVTTHVLPTTNVPTIGGSTSKAPNSTASTAKSGGPSHTSPSTLTSVRVAPSKTSATSSPTIKPTSGGAGSVAAPGLLMVLFAFGSYLFV